MFYSGFPVLYYSPETKLAFGGAGSLVFHRPDDTLKHKPSQVQLGMAYTLNNQLLTYAPFRIYSRHDFLVFYGEAGYYKYSYYFYGIGNHQPATEKELYKVDYPEYESTHWLRSVLRCMEE